MDLDVEISEPQKPLVPPIRAGLEKAIEEEIRNPFINSCGYITKPAKVRVASPIARRCDKVKFAFLSFKRLPSKNVLGDAIPLCGSCSQGLSGEACYNRLMEELATPRQGQRLTCSTGLDTRACRRKLMSSSSRLALDNLTRYKSALKQAIGKYEADVVCVNELGIPALRNGPKEGFFQVSNQWTKKGSLIVAGSFHDFRTKYNTGYVFVPNGPEEGHPFHKQVSATKVDEYVSIPSDRHSVVVPAFGLNIGVMVCLDLLDYSSIAAMTRLRDSIDFILVPAYSKELRQLNEVAAMASRAMPGGVGIINYDHGKARSSSMHLFGQRLKPKTDVLLGSGYARLTLYEIDYSSFKTEKVNKQDIESEVSYLLRLPIFSEG